MLPLSGLLLPSGKPPDIEPVPDGKYLVAPPIPGNRAGLIEEMVEGNGAVPDKNPLNLCETLLGKPPADDAIELYRFF